MASFSAISTSATHQHSARDPVSWAAGIVAWVSGVSTIAVASLDSLANGVTTAAILAGLGLIVTFVIGTYGKWRREKLKLDLEERRLRRADERRDAENQHEIDKVKRKSPLRKIEDLENRAKGAEAREAALLVLVDDMRRQIKMNSKGIHANAQSIRAITDSHPELPVTLDIQLDDDVKPSSLV